MADPADAAKNGLPVDAKPEGAADAAEAPFTHVPDNPAFPEEDDTPSAMDGYRYARPVQRTGQGRSGSRCRCRSAARPARSRPGGLCQPPGRDAPTRAPTLGAASRPDQAALARAARGKPVEDLPPMPRPPQAGARPATTPGGCAAVSPGPGRTGFGLVRAARVAQGQGQARPAATAPHPAPRGGGAVAAPAAGPADAAKSLTRPGGTFGSQPTPRPRSRAVLFLTLLAVLMLCLALIAAWSSYYLASNRATDGTATATAPPATEAGRRPMAADPGRRG